MANTPETAEPIWRVDCRGAPANIRPAVDAIMRAENWLLSRLPKGQPLVIIMGEVHTFQTHPLVQQAVVMEHLPRREQYPFAFGFETHRKHLRGFFDNSDGAKSLHDVCEEQKVSLSYNDVSRLELRDGLLRGTVINPSDRQTRRHAKKLKLDLENMEDPSMGSRESMAFRNSFIVENAIKHIKETGARIYIQSCGMRHLFGGGSRMYGQREGSPYEESLTALFLKKGMKVLPVFLAADHPFFELDREHEDMPIPEHVRTQAVRVTEMFDGVDYTAYESVRRSVNDASGYDLK